MERKVVSYKSELIQLPDRESSKHGLHSTFVIAAICTNHIPSLTEQGKCPEKDI